jgi:hypothetical protein
MALSSKPCPERGDVVRADRGALVGQTLGEEEEGLRRVVEICAPPILGEPVHHPLIVDLIPEVV